MPSGYSSLNTSFEEHRPNYGSTQAKVTYANVNTAEYFKVCDKIITNIFSINNAATNLERMGRLIGSRNDSQTIRDRISQLSADTITYVGETTILVKTMLSLVERDKQRKVRAHRLQSEFQVSAARFSKLQKKVVTTYSHSRLPLDMVPPSEDSTSEMITSGEQDLIRKQEQTHLEYDLTMKQELQQRVQALEKDVVDIEDIMRQLSTMTAAQGEIVTTIEDNVENTAGSVEEGRTELVKAARYQTARRKRCCVLILILILILIISGIIIALHYTNLN